MRRSLALLLAAPLLALAPASAHAAGTCQGLPATIESSSIDITGTEGPDVILATGSAHIHALGGDDVICAAGGDVDAGAGNDSVLVDRYGGINIENADLGPGVDRYTSTEASMIDTVTSGVPTEPNLDVIDTGPAGDNVRVVLSPGSHPQVSGGPSAEPFDFVDFVAVTGDSAVWDLQLPSTLTRAGDSMGTFSGFSSARLDLGALASATVHGTAGADRVTIGAGKIDADLGAGKDTVFLDRFHAVPGSGRIDFGSGKDTLDVDSLTPFKLDLRNGSAGGLTVTDLELSVLAAPKVRYQGGRGNDTVYAVGCNVVLRGGPGNDDLFYANDDWRPSLPSCKHYRFRIFGQSGNDDMVGWTGRDVLDGGQGRDRANGKQNLDVCRAELERQCER